MEKDRGALDGYHLGEALGPVANLLGRRCGAAAVKLLRDRLAEIIGAPEDDRYSYMWRPAVENHEQNLNSNEFRAVLLEALRDSALGAAAAGGDAGAPAVQLLLTAQYPTLVRVGINVCSENYPTLAEEFWRYFDAKWLAEPVYWHELYWLLKKNYKRFSAAQRSDFLAFIRGLHGDWREEKNAGEWDERQRRDVLHPVAGLGDGEVDALYSELVQRWGPVREHPDFHSYHGAAWVGERSPLTTDSLLAMNDSALVKFLSEFEPSPGAWDGPTFRGLASAISDAVRASADGFSSKLPLFVDLKRPYQHGVLSGLRHRAADDKKPIDWGAVVSFIEQIVASPSFRPDLEGEKSEGWEPSILWVVGDIADLLKAAASDGSSVARDLYERGVGVLQQVLEVIEPSPAAQLEDPVSHTINAPRGRSLEAMVNIALAMRRAMPTDPQLKDDVWNLVGPTFEAELVESVRGANGEFATIAGLYCANLHFLNGPWVERHFGRLFSTENEAAWRCAAEGFAYQRYLYEWLFRHLRDGGHLRRMIRSHQASNQVGEKALQFLALAYLEGHEGLDSGGILRELVDALEAEQMIQLCWFFWTLRHPEPDGTSGRSHKILDFWRKVSEVARATGAELPEVQSALNQLAPFIEQLDEPTTRMWSEAAKFAQVRYHGNVLLENLARLAPGYPRPVFQVFQSALINFLPDFEEEDAIQCVMRIAESGHREEAEWLCNEYANRGSGLLKHTYETLRGRQENGASAQPVIR